MPMEPRPAAIPAVAPGLSALAERYDVFLVDQWGVLHAGAAPLPGAVAALAALRARGARVVILTNSGKRAAANVHALAGHGIPATLFAAVHSSGEAAWRALRARAEPALAALGRRCLFLARGDDPGILEGLDLRPVTDAARADFVFNTGVDPLVRDWESHTARLAPAAARGLPMVCANPDLTAPLDGRLVFGAGALADWYQARGAPVIRFGKPDPAFVEGGLALAGPVDRARVLVIGDSLDHDILGAARAGLDSALVAGGIHAGPLGLADGPEPDPAALDALAARAGARPTHVLKTFAW